MSVMFIVDEQAEGVGPRTQMRRVGVSVWRHVRHGYSQVHWG